MLASIAPKTTTDFVFRKLDPSAWDSLSDASDDSDDASPAAVKKAPAPAGQGTKKFNLHTMEFEEESKPADNARMGETLSKPKPREFGLPQSQLVAGDIVGSMDAVTKNELRKADKKTEEKVGGSLMPHEDAKTTSEMTTDADVKTTEFMAVEFGGLAVPLKSTKTDGVGSHDGDRLTLKHSDKEVSVTTVLNGGAQVKTLLKDPVRSDATPIATGISLEDEINDLIRGGKQAVRTRDRYPKVEVIKTTQKAFVLDSPAEAAVRDGGRRAPGCAGETEEGDGHRS